MQCNSILHQFLCVKLFSSQDETTRQTVEQEVKQISNDYSSRIGVRRVYGALLNRRRRANSAAAYYRRQ